MKLKLPDTVSSLQDVIALKNEVREYARWYAHESIKKDVHAKNITKAPVLSVAASMLLHDMEAQNALNRRGLDELVAALTNYASTAKTITITLAAPATQSVKATLVGWCRENITPNILVTFQFNTTLLGGMVVQYGSRIFDWSFKRQLLGARESFPEILRHV